MKKSLYLLLGILLICGIYQACAPDVELPGSIYGVVTDKATGEPIKSAGVTLNPNGATTVTGSDGCFEFTGLAQGGYAVVIAKTDYKEYTSGMITVETGQTTHVDVQLEKLPPSLRVVNNDNEDIDVLDFGAQKSDISRSFNIFNDGESSLEWEITYTADWIKSVSKTSGILRAGATQALVVTIDREKMLESGKYTTTIHIVSNNGSKSIQILAIGANTVLSTVRMLDVQPQGPNSMVFNAEIMNVGNPKYVECGFVYSTKSKPTIDNCMRQLLAPMSDTNIYSYVANGLEKGQTYYVRAYIINVDQISYSNNEVEFTVIDLPTFEYAGALYYVYPSIDNVDWYQAFAVCDGLTYYGYDDWYMPNYNELNAMYAQRNSIGGFGNDPYWTNVDGDMAYCIHFSWSGGTGNYEKSRENNVRCIRKN